MDRSNASFLFDLPGRYRIRVQGKLDPSWSDRVSGLDIAIRRPANQQPMTILTGEVRDQAALLGILNVLYDFGFPLLKVERLVDSLHPEDPSR